MYLNRILRRAALVAALLIVAGQPLAANAATAVASITLTTPNKTLLIGNKETIKAVAKDSRGHTISGVTFAWTSSKKTSVTVTSRGVATAKAAGSAKITATAGGKTASVTIKVPTPTSLGGVAAKGTAIAGAEVDLVDKRGKTLTTTTDSDGNYSLDTTGLTPPFLIAVHVDDTHVLYSVSADTNTASVINVTPLTDLIIRSWYSVQGLDVSTDGFADPVANPPPSPTEVAIISNVVVQVTALWLQQAGVDTTTFSPISTPFAVGDNVDGVLDQTTVNPDTGAITITDGTTTQDSTVTYDTGAGSVTVDTTTTNGTDTSTSTTGTVVATTDDTTAALAGITTALTNFANTVNTKGSALTANNLLPFIDTGILNEGLNRSQFAASTADQFRGITVSFQVLNISSLDTTNGLADVNFLFTESLGDQSQTQTVEFFFKKQSDGTWRLYGDQLPAKLQAQAEMRTDQGSDASTPHNDVNIDIRPLTGLYSGITVTGGGVFSSKALELQGTEVDTYTPDPTKPDTQVTVTKDSFFANATVTPDQVPPGTDMAITMTPVTGSPVTYHVKTNALTTEAISITNLSDSTFTTGAHAGTPLHVEWTLPTTFAISEVKLDGHGYTADNVQCDSDKPILSITSTSGDVTIPTTCNGADVTSANLNVQVIGVNGEREIIIYEFQDPTP